MRHAAIAASLGFIFSASASATLIESYMDTRTSLALQVPKKTVVIKETGGTGTISADAKTLNNGSENHKFSLDKKGGNIHEIRKANGTVFIKDLDSDYLSTTAEKGSEKGEYAKGFGSQITGERNRTVAGKDIHEWTVDLATSAKAQADTTLKESSASAKGTSEDPWMFFSEDFASIGDDFLLLDFDLVAGTGFGASAGGASSGMLYLDTTISGLEHLMRIEMGSPRPGSSSPWFHVTSNPLLGLDDAALGVALAAAFQLDSASSSWTLASSVSLVSMELPTARLGSFGFSFGTESNANAAVPEPSLMLPAALILCAWVRAKRQRVLSAASSVRAT